MIYIYLYIYKELAFTAAWLNLDFLQNKILIYLDASFSENQNTLWIPSILNILTITSEAIIIQSRKTAMINYI